MELVEDKNFPNGVLGRLSENCESDSVRAVADPELGYGGALRFF